MAESYNIEEIVQTVLSRMAAISQGVSELRTVTSLDGLVSLPALTSSKKEVVDAPLTLLSKPAMDAAAAVQEKITAAQAKIEEMNSALLSLGTLTNETTIAKENAIKATEEATKKLSEMSSLMDECTQLFDGLDEKNTQADGLIVRVNGIISSASSLEQRLSDAVEEALEFVGQLESWAEAERLRVQAENSRVTAESSRESAERSRLNAESERADAESKRVSAEKSRVQAENGRESAEEERASDENLRVQAETARAEAESNRSQAETERKSAESARLQEFGELKSESEAATLSANTAATKANEAATNAKNLPKIQNGTWWIYETSGYTDTGISATGKSPKIVDEIWWVYDDSKGEYVNTGISVSSTYQLTKEKIIDALGYTPPEQDTTYNVVGGNGSTGLVKNGSTVTSAAGYIPCPIVDGVPYYKDTNTTYTLSSFGVMATATELNYCKDVKSPIQEQLNGKAQYNQEMYIGNTPVAINRSSAVLTLNGVNISGSSGSCTGNAATASSVAWSGVTNRPTRLSQFTNDSGYLTSTAANQTYATKSEIGDINSILDNLNGEII